ncbi:MAG: M14 family metallopeptidase, partial [Ignavibacteria bacterium]|nr:M14 family metallopeptidase [Ignavibacteria bacterium]
MNTPKIYFSLSLFFAIICFFIFGFNSGSVNHVQEKYSLVKISASTPSDFERLENAGLHIDHAESIDDYILTWLSETEIGLLKQTGLSYLIQIPDWMEYYNSRSVMTEAEKRAAILQSVENYNVSHSVFGSMGGYLTYQEIINKLDSMRLEYPGLISVKFSIGNSHEGRPMWTVRVSNSPNAPTGRPEVWFHSLIHAREPMSATQNIYFIYWLLENYNIHPLATYILRYRELYFTPVFNPDGYEYNRQTNPNGGGMWRISRKPCSGGIGADMNRNFGPYAFWNWSGGGSSTVCGSETFRGDSPFDQIETFNAMNFVNSRNFRGILSYHTYGNYFIRPWGYSGTPTPDENIFQNMSADMALQNHYTLGRSLDTFGYPVRGVTDDWYYNDSGHARIIAMTPEVGTSTDGFWPPQSRILPLAQSTVWSNIYFALACGGYTAPTSLRLNKLNYSAGESGNLKVHFRNKGLMSSPNVKIQLTSLSPYINISSASFNYNSIAPGYQDSVTLNFNILTNAPVNSGLPIQLTIRQNDTSLVHTEKIHVCIGSGILTLADSAENGNGNWTMVGGWNTTTSQFYSPTRSFTESPTGNYSNSTNRTMTLASGRNISSNPVTILTFWHRHQIEIMDNAYIEVSSDNGTTWNSVKYFNGDQLSWKQEVLDITEYATNVFESLSADVLKNIGLDCNDVNDYLISSGIKVNYLD